MSRSPFPKIVTSLPPADIAFEGVQGWLLQGEKRQLVFMEIAPIGVVAPHAHGAQWGIVVEGEMELTIGGKTRVYGKGDSYFIAAGTVHEARFATRTFVIDLFADPDRYAPKKVQAQARAPRSGSAGGSSG